MKFTETDYQIKSMLYDIIAVLGGQSDILSTIGSWKDSMPDEDILLSLKCWFEEKGKDQIGTLIIAGFDRNKIIEMANQPPFDNNVKPDDVGLDMVL